MLFATLKDGGFGFATPTLAREGPSVVPVRGSDSDVEEVRDQLGITPGEPVADAVIRGMEGRESGREVPWCPEPGIYTREH